MLKITKADEVIEVKTLTTTIYSQPGLGKTSLAFTAKNPLLLDFDHGSYRAVDRKDTVQIEAWSDVANITDDDLVPYDTVIIDTVGKALDFLAADILAKNARLGYGGALNQQGWGQLGVRFRGFLASLQKRGKDIVLISHMDEKYDGDEVKERLKIPGGSKELVLTDSDMIGRISIHNKQRLLIFSPTETSFGKDPAGFGSLQLPDATSPDFAVFLAHILEVAKDALNSMSKEQVERKSEVEWFAQHIPTIKDADGINAVLGRAKKAGNDVAKLVVARANVLQLEFDAATKSYVYLEEMETGGDSDGENIMREPDETDEAAA